MTEEFLSALEKYLRLKHVKLSLGDQWSETAPANVRDTELDTFTRRVSEVKTAITAVQQVFFFRGLMQKPAEYRLCPTSTDLMVITPLMTFELSIPEDLTRNHI